MRDRHISELERYSRALWFHVRQPLVRMLSDIPAPPKVTAKAVYCLDVESRSSVFAKNANFKLPPASTIKLATALVLVRATKGDLSKVVEIEAKDCIRGSRMGLMEGDRVSHFDLLHGLLLSSGNDAAQAIARTVGQILLRERRTEGDPVACFVLAMNQLVKALGLTRTRITNPSGLPERGLYSTARDIGILAAEAFSDPIVQNISRRRSHFAKILGPNSRGLSIRSTVAMLGEHGVICGKTGSAPCAGSCIALGSAAAGRSFVTVLMASPGDARRYADAEIVLKALLMTSFAVGRDAATRGGQMVQQRGAAQLARGDFNVKWRQADEPTVAEPQRHP